MPKVYCCAEKYVLLSLLSYCSFPLGNWLGRDVLFQYVIKRNSVMKGCGMGREKSWTAPKCDLRAACMEVEIQFRDNSKFMLLWKRGRFHFQVPDFAGTLGRKFNSAFVSFFSYFVYGNSCDIFPLIILWLRYARYLIRSKVQVVAHGSSLVIFTFTIPNYEGFCLLVTPHLLFTTQENGHIPSIDTIRLY